MVLSNLSKVPILTLVFLSTQSLAESATNHLSDNTVATREVFVPDLSQAYYIPYQKYIPSPGQKYVSAPENQIPIAISSTEKPIPSIGYKTQIDASKYAIHQTVNPSQGAHGGQGSNQYLYTIAEVTPATTARYPTVSKIRHNDLFQEVPKKYHYGYRVSNPHTGAEFGHSEVNDGISARGYYHVLLPDGRLQNVKYWAGPLGYHATITYENQY